MIKYPQKNKVGLFRKLRAEEWIVTHYSNGKPYQEGDTLLYATVVEPLYSYGRNYKKFGKEFSLFIWTTESDIHKIEKHFESVVKNMKREDFENKSDDRFIYLEADYKGDNK